MVREAASKLLLSTTWGVMENPVALVDFSVAVISSVTKNNFGEERVYLAYKLQYILLGCQAKSSREEPGGRNRSRDYGRTLLTGLLPGSCSVAFLIKARRPTSIGMVPSTVDCTHLSSQENALAT